ncbi:MAG: twin-arginine translocation signal domain-containing protein, partial [Bacillus sp. (in: firmicutes)]
MAKNTNIIDESSAIGKKISRRDILKTAGVGGVGVLLGASGLGGLLSITESKATTKESHDIVPFYGKQQGG